VTALGSVCGSPTRKEEIHHYTATYAKHQSIFEGYEIHSILISTGYYRRIIQKWDAEKQLNFISNPAECPYAYILPMFVPVETCFSQFFLFSSL
jgi:hypothetical protein